MKVNFKLILEQWTFVLRQGPVNFMVTGESNPIPPPVEDITFGSDTVFWGDTIITFND